MPPSAERGAGAVCGNRAARAGRSRMGRGGRRTRGVERGLAAALARTAVSRGLNSELPAGDRATGPVPQRVGAQDPVGEPCADSRGQRGPRSAPSPLGGPQGRGSEQSPAPPARVASDAGAHWEPALDLAGCGKLGSEPRGQVGRGQAHQGGGVWRRGARRERARGTKGRGCDGGRGREGPRRQS